MNTGVYGCMYVCMGMYVWVYGWVYGWRYGGMGVLGSYADEAAERVGTVGKQVCTGIAGVMIVNPIPRMI